jgi:hypothetical protein
MDGSLKVSGVDEGGGEGGEVGVGVFMGIVGRKNIVGRGVAMGITPCVSAMAVLAVDTAVSRISASLSVGVDGTLLQDASTAAARNKWINNVLPTIFILPLPMNIYL